MTTIHLYEDCIMKKQGKTEEGSKIGIAVSGGKDSIVTLHLMHDIFSKRPNKPNEIKLIL